MEKHGHDNATTVSTVRVQQFHMQSLRQSLGEPCKILVLLLTYKGGNWRLREGECLV